MVLESPYSLLSLENYKRRYVFMTLKHVVGHRGTIIS